MTYHPDPRNRFCTVRLQPSGEFIQLPVKRLKKPVQGQHYKSHEYIEYQGDQYLLPEYWAALTHVYEIEEATA